MKRAIQVAGKRYTPSAEFRKRMMQQKIAAKNRGAASVWGGR